MDILFKTDGAKLFVGVELVNGIMTRITKRNDPSVFESLYLSNYCVSIHRLRLFVIKVIILLLILRTGYTLIFVIINLSDCYKNATVLTIGHSRLAFKVNVNFKLVHEHLRVTIGTLYFFGILVWIFLDKVFDSLFGLRLTSLVS